MLKRFFNGEYKKITISTIAATVIALGLGFLLHYTFEWTNNLFVGLFSAVNESIWEHLKLLFMPYAVLMAFEYALYGKHISNFFIAKLIGILAGLSTVAMNYYFYTGAFGIQNMPFNIVLFIAGVLVAYGTAYLLIIKGKRRSHALLEAVAILSFGALCTAFFFFTLYPPHLPIFMDVSTGGYGIS